MITAPARKAAKKPVRRPRKPDITPPDTNPAPEPEAALAPTKPAPLEMSRAELEHGGTRVGVGVWTKHKDGAAITVRLDRKAGTWDCAIERNGIRVERRGRGYLTICRQAIDDLNTQEQSA